MYKNIKKALLCVVAAAAVLSCQKTPDVKVHASFTTDKESYEVYDVIQITNTTVVENSRMAICKWEYNGKVSYDMPAPEDLMFETVGKFPVTLTVTSEEGAVKGTFTKEIEVTDSNPHPVVDFSWSPTEVIAGEEIQFTDHSTDADGIAAWDWTFGTSTSTEQNPKFTFKETGDIIVTLKVTDNARRTTTVSKTITVERGVNYLDLIWAKPFDSVPDAYVYGTSPAVTADGSRIYVHSTGMHLVAFDTEGNQQWSFDTSTEGASVICNDGHIRNQSPTPSVAEDGMVYVAVGFDEPKKGFNGVFGVDATGKKKWYTTYGRGASFRFMAPMIFGDYVATNQGNTGQVVEDGDEKVFDGQNFVILNRHDGQLKRYLYCDSGPRGGLAAMAYGDSYLLFAQTGSSYGTRIYYPMDGDWKIASGGNTNSRPFNLANGQTSDGHQIAITNDKKIYTLYKNCTIYCHDVSAYQYDTAPADIKLWELKLEGSSGQYGIGCVTDEQGVAYVTLKDALHAVNPDGTLKWTEKPDGEIRGVAAIDNAGGVYYNDCKTGKLIKITPEGKRVVELSLSDPYTSEAPASGMRTSPTIAPDGTIYCTGMKGGQPTLFCVKGSATGHANSWSQLGGNPSKTGVLTVK